MKSRPTGACLATVVKESRVNLTAPSEELSPTRQVAAIIREALKGGKEMSSLQLKQCVRAVCPLEAHDMRMNQAIAYLKRRYEIVSDQSRQPNMYRLA